MHYKKLSVCIAACHRLAKHFELGSRIWFYNKSANAPIYVAGHSVVACLPPVVDLSDVVHNRLSSSSTNPHLDVYEAILSC